MWESVVPKAQGGDNFINAVDYTVQQLQEEDTIIE